ncbi:MAG: hypothetical protein AAF353_13380 [Pseudomonadota bacterium]
MSKGEKLITDIYNTKRRIFYRWLKYSFPSWHEIDFEGLINEAFAYVSVMDIPPSMTKSHLINLIKVKCHRAVIDEIRKIKAVKRGGPGSRKTSEVKEGFAPRLSLDTEEGKLALNEYLSGHPTRMLQNEMIEDFFYHAMGIEKKGIAYSEKEKAIARSLQRFGLDDSDVTMIYRGMLPGEREQFETNGKLTNAGKEEIAKRRSSMRKKMKDHISGEDVPMMKKLKENKRRKRITGQKSRPFPQPHRKTRPGENPEIR